MFTDPIDTLKVYLNENVFVKLRSGENIEGKLIGFDEFHSLLLSFGNETRFIRGENILLIGEKTE